MIMALTGYQTHLTVILVALAILMIGIGAAVFLKGKKKWFLNAHKIFELVGVSLASVAAILGGFLFTLVHAIIGVILAGGLWIGVIGGFIYLKMPAKGDQGIQKKKKMRTMHIWAGRIYIGLFLVNMFVGFATI